ncbi:VanZ family protein [Bacilliculturomica massiliensis]|uniref:VanZ family protein n=1 Tax=Bacilliculturomica massiliensis TaxID=1917867 RepID=UPI00103145EB|nr:VanZ family protein [Bacilliculturomica massiliensis]
MNLIRAALANYLFTIPISIALETILCQYYKTKKVKITYGFVVGFQLFLLLLTAMLTITGAGGVDDIGCHGDVILSLDAFNLTPFTGWGRVNFFGLSMNAVLFIPLGAALPLLWKNGVSFLRTSLTGFLFSLLIETSQLLNWRTTDIDDLIMNTIGTMIGFGLSRLLLKKITVVQIDNSNTDFFVMNSASLCTVLFFSAYFFIGSPMLNAVWEILYQ